MIGKQSILEGIVAEDICERGGDDGAEAVTGQRPGSMFAARTAPEVVTREENLQPFDSGLVDDEIRFGGFVGVVAPVGKKRRRRGCSCR